MEGGERGQKIQARGGGIRGRGKEWGKKKKLGDRREYEMCHSSETSTR